VKVFARYNSRANIGMFRFLPRQIMEQVEIIAGDLRDEDAIRGCVKGCEAVYHLGALVSIPYSYRNPVEVTHVNFLGTFNLLMECRDYQVGRLIHTSTCEVFGTERYTAIDERHPLLKPPV
jgi:dTDP-glucose 4,6-dehydratase